MNTISDHCAVIAVYGLRGTPTTLEAFYDAVTDWIQSLGHDIDRLAISGTGYSGRMGSFKGLDRKLRANAFAGATHVELYALLPGWAIETRDYLVEATWSEQYSYALVAARTSIADLRLDAIRPVANALVCSLEAAYGIGYERPHTLGPSLYAVGIAQGLGSSGAQYEQALEISEWSSAMQAEVYRTGVLRDVYPWNFLRDVHLERSIEGRTLGEWIRENPRRGELSSFCDGTYLWQVEDQARPPISRALRSAGLLYM